MAIVREIIPVHKHFLMIDSPIEFDLIANNGTDIVHRPAGAWRVDLYTLLPEKFFKQYPVFVLEIEYDDTNLNGKTVIIRESDIDLGTGIAGLNGQEVFVTNYPEFNTLKIYKTVKEAEDLIEKYGRLAVIPKELYLNGTDNSNKTIKITLYYTSFYITYDNLTFYNHQNWTISEFILKEELGVLQFSIKSSASFTVL